MSPKHRLAILGLACTVATATLASARDLPSLAADFQWNVAPEAETYYSPGYTDREQQALDMKALHQGLVAREADRGLAAALRVEVSPEQWRELEHPGRELRKLRVGIDREVGLHIDFASLALGEIAREAQSLDWGALRGTEEGGFVWTAIVEAPDATGLRLHFSDLSLAPGAELFVYTSQGQAAGPFTGRGHMGRGEQWTGTMFSDQVILQLHHPGPVTASTLAETRLVLGSVGVMGPDFVLGRLARPIDTIQTKAFCSFNEDCVVNASCSAPSSINAVRDAVAHILFRSGAFYYICSGGLLADTTQSGTPYFLTANHCLSKGNEANSLETYFQYSTSCNNPDCSSPYGSPRNPDTLGGTVLSTNKTSDYTLLQLAQAPPAGSAFLGWSSAPVATSWNTPLYRISHPKGAPQAYSEHRVKDYGFACNSWPVGPWIYSEDVIGATEGGSSGSPVVILDDGPKVVGQLSGACGYSPSDVCNTIDNATVDGALAHYFSAVESYLAPGDGGGGGGGGGGGECKEVGQSCSSNSECCSGKCRGGPNNSTCRN